MDEKISIKLWLISLVVFVGVVVASSAVEQGGGFPSILDHQAAGTGERVNEIQTRWREGGVRNIAIFAVVADLAWIWIYALGSFLVGKGFASKREGALRLIGLVIVASAIVFVLADYIETTLQFVQLLRDAGDDTLASVAASAQPIKIVAFIAAFIGVILVVAIDRLKRASST